MSEWISVKYRLPDEAAYFPVLAGDPMEAFWNGEVWLLASCYRQLKAGDKTEVFDVTADVTHWISYDVLLEALERGEFVNLPDPEGMSYCDSITAVQQIEKNKVTAVYRDTKDTPTPPLGSDNDLDDSLIGNYADNKDLDPNARPSPDTDKGFMPNPHGDPNSAETETLSHKPEAPELKPCPFCGGEFQISTMHKEDMGGRYERYSGECQGCFIHTDNYVDVDELISAWNRRAGVPESERKDKMFYWGDGRMTCLVCGAESIDQEAPKAPDTEGALSDQEIDNILEGVELPGIEDAPKAPEFPLCPFCKGKMAVEREGTPRQSCIVICEDCGCKLESNEKGSGAAWRRRPIEDELRATIATTNTWKVAEKIYKDEIATLKAEIEQAHKDTQEARELAVELKAENKGLKAGYTLANEDIKRLRAENERLKEGISWVERYIGNHRVPEMLEHFIRILDALKEDDIDQARRQV